MSDKIPLAPVWEHYSDTPLPRTEGRFKALCVIHEETRPSAVVDLNRNTIKCFVCDLGGDAIDLVQAKEGLGFADAKQRAASLSGTEDGAVSGGPVRAKRERPVGLLGRRSRADAGDDRAVPSGVRRKPRGI